MTIKNPQINNPPQSSPDEVFSKKLNEVKDYQTEFKSLVNKSYTKDTVQALCKARGVEYAEGDEFRVVEGVISTEGVDRQGDIVRAEGMDFTDFRKNPVIVWSHNSETYPVGVSLNEQVFTDGKTKGIKATLLFQTITDEGYYILELIKKGMIRAFSLGFKPKPNGVTRPSQADQKALGMPVYGAIFTASLLYEITICTLPANADSLVTAISKSLTGDLRQFAIKHGLINNSPDEVLSMDITKEELEKMITAQIVTKSGAKYSKATLEAHKAIHTKMEEHTKGLKSCMKQLKDLFEPDPEEGSEDDKEKALYPLFPAEKEPVIEKKVPEKPAFDTNDLLIDINDLLNKVNGLQVAK